MSVYAVDRAYVQQCLSEMVRIDSINPSLIPGGTGEKDIAAYLAEACSQLGLDVIIQEVAPPGRVNVIAHWGGSSGGKSLLLTGHMDTVGIEGMTIPPFSPEVRDGLLYGRGAYDMKGGLASILGAVKALREAKYRPAGDITLAFVADEEHASLGTQVLVSEIGAQAAILVEPTGMKICTAHRGFVWLAITTKGHAEHGSLYDRGIDAIAHMGIVLEAMRDMDQNQLPQKIHPLLGRASVHASLIEGGLGLSTYPDSCSLKIEHRTLPGETAQDVLRLWHARLEKLASQQEHFSAEVELLLERPAFEISPFATIVTSLSEAVNQVTGSQPDHAGNLAWLDSAILASAGIETVIFGPGGSGAHAAVEYVKLADVFTCAEILANIAGNWAGKLQ